MVQSSKLKFACLLGLLFAAGVAHAQSGADCGSTNPAAACTGTSVTTNSQGVDFTYQFTCNGGSCQLGRFLDGTPWVRNPTGGAVVITSATPDNARTGLEKNPATGDEVPPVTASNDVMQQGMWTESRSDSTYVASKDLSTQLPYSAAADNAVYVKTDDVTFYCEYTEALTSGCINSYGALVVLNDLPPDNKNGTETFRPAMSGDVKRFFTLADFDFSRLPSFTGSNLDVMPSYAEIARRYLNGPVLNLYGSESGDMGRAWVPKASGLPDYAAYASQQMNLAIFRTLDGGALTAEKRRAVYAIIQYGIDVYGAFMQKVDFNGGAGQMQGRWAPMVYLGALTTDATVRANIRAASSNMSSTNNGNNLQFIELYQVRAGTEGAPLWGSYPGEDGCSTGGWNGKGRYWANYAEAVLRGQQNKKTCGDPYGYIDGPAESPGSGYFSVAGGNYISIGLLQKIWPEFDYVANNPVMKGFAERIMDGAGYWTKPDQCAVIDPRESNSCDPYTSASSCTYFGETWGVDIQGGNESACVTKSVAAQRGHPNPIGRFEATHLRGRLASGDDIHSEKPGCQLWDTLLGQSPRPPTKVPRAPAIQSVN